VYAKIFRQIFDSSIAENYEVRHVFEDLLKLAEIDGCVDMTLEAIARRTNVPLDKVRVGIDELCKPDPKSRSKEHEGRRLIPIDARRGWGWRIVNYEKYRAIQDEETRRATWRESKRNYRAKKRAKKKLRPLPGQTAYVRAVESGAPYADEISDQFLPDACKQPFSAPHIV
jgi:hypothetical protein